MVLLNGVADMEISAVVSYCKEELKLIRDNQKGLRVRLKITKKHLCPLLVPSYKPCLHTIICILNIPPIYSAKMSVPDPDKCKYGFLIQHCYNTIYLDDLIKTGSNSVLKRQETSTSLI